MTTFVQPSILTETLLEHVSSRTQTYDRENRFFSEDFEELREAGYLKLAVPQELGSFGDTLAQVCAEQR
jgi:alkylation response protein AidB-like acyl-CoA dehydrogenase